MWIHMASPEIMKIKDLEENIGNFSIVARVMEKSEIKTIRGEKCTSAIVEDETGRVKLNLSENQVGQVRVGQIVKVWCAFTEVRGKFLEISSWKDLDFVL
jgi:ssDNA-binding replication factor A large subunit